MRLILLHNSDDDSSFFRDLDGLCSTPGVELGENFRGVSLHRVLTHEQPGGDLTVAQPAGNQRENLELARSQAETLNAGQVWGEPGAGGDDHFANDHSFGRSRKLESQPDSEAGKEEGYEPAVDLERVLDYEKPELDPLEQRDECARKNAVEKDGPLHAPTI